MFTFGKTQKASYAWKNEMKSAEKAEVVYGNFEWNAAKAAENLKMHKISFEEATEVFNDPFFILFNDPDHSFDEQRFIIIGEVGKTSLFVRIICRTRKNQNNKRQRINDERTKRL